MKKSLRILAVVSLAIVFSSIASAQLPFRLQQNYMTGLSSPVFLTNAGDGSRRIFIVQQGSGTSGTIRVAQPGSTTTTLYLTVSGVATGGERGLLGLAFHPNFENNRRFFIYYTRSGDGAIQIDEYEQDATNPNIANPNRVRQILTVPHPTFSNHNGGTIAFGPDGFLYAGTGDGGSGNDPGNNAQNINSLLGKMIRIDINTPVAQTPAYNIPSDNPYAGATPGADEIFAIGLRNPYRFSFDRGGTNQLWVADVGQGAVEEVSIVTRGANMGWRVYEGTRCTNLDPLCTSLTQTPPVFEYTRSMFPARCSITGGHIYRGRQNSLPVGSYIFGDYCSGEIILWHQNTQAVLRDTANNNLVAFGEDEDGELYVVRSNGNIDRVVGNRASGDFDGDGGADFTVFRSTNGYWYSLNPLTSATQFVQWGTGTDIPVPDDYDGDGRTDQAVFRAGEWFYLRSSNFTLGSASWGAATDIPAPGDFDGDGRADITVYRPDTGTWFTLLSTNNQVVSQQFGAPGDVILNGDYDGDSKDDYAVFRPSTGTWYGKNSISGLTWGGQFGTGTDTPVPADYDGDGRLDVAVFRKATGEWFILQTSTGTVRIQSWGGSDDIPVVGDYDRDGRDDIAVFRETTGTWFVYRSSNGTLMAGSWGFGTDDPMPFADRP